MLLRDRDNYTGGTPNGMTSASDGTLEERRYYVQNWRADVVAVTKSDGVPLEYVRYSAYGEPTVHPIADLNLDGVVDTTDADIWQELQDDDSQDYPFRRDLDWSGSYAAYGDDYELIQESYSANVGLSGKGRVSSAGVGNTIGYAGYVWDQTLRANHVRHRVYLPEIGRWTRRDPLGYVDGMGLYEYVGGAAQRLIDPVGLFQTGLRPPIIRQPVAPSVPVPGRAPASPWIETVPGVYWPPGTNRPEWFPWWMEWEPRLTRPKKDPDRTPDIGLPGKCYSPTPSSKPKPDEEPEEWDDDMEFYHFRKVQFCRVANRKIWERLQALSCPSSLDDPKNDCKNMPAQEACDQAILFEGCIKAREQVLQWHTHCPGGTPDSNGGHRRAINRMKEFHKKCDEVCGAWRNLPSLPYRGAR